MRVTFLSPLAGLFLFLGVHHDVRLRNNPFSSTVDSGIIGHNTDGQVGEWPADRFSSDKLSGIQYAIDNDGQNLYVALNIAEMGEQMKIMRMGMSFFIDLKAKKKENRGIEFPVKREGGPLQAGEYRGGDDQARDRDGQQGNQRPDFKKMRAMMSLNLYSLKLFGFSEGEPKEQGLDLKDNVQIAYQWDTADVMHIEYLVPLKFITDDINSLNNKEISAGWKVNGMDMPSGENGFNSGGFGGGGGRGGFGGRGGGSGGFRGGGSPGINRNTEQMQQRMKEQKIWTKYTFTLGTPAKAF
jgi:uncharacterized membrane protein YgcG